MNSVQITPDLLRQSDAVVLVTDHSDVDYAAVAAHSPLVIDTRGAMRTVECSGRVIGLSRGQRNPSPQLLEYVAAV